MLTNTNKQNYGGLGPERSEGESKNQQRVAVVPKSDASDTASQDGPSVEKRKPNVVAVAMSPKDGKSASETGSQKPAKAPPREPSQVLPPVEVEQTPAVKQIPVPNSALRMKGSDSRYERFTDEIEVTAKPASKLSTQAANTALQQPQIPLHSTPAFKAIEPTTPLDLQSTKGDFQAPAMTQESQETVRSDRTVSKAEPIVRPMMQQMAYAARQSGGGSVEIKLSPEELGRVRLALTPGETNIVVHISVERPETLELIRRNIDVFSQSLKQEGFANPDFSFEQSGNGFASSDEETDSNQKTFDGPHPKDAQRVDLPRRATGAHGQLDIRL
jgi:flagellar hook-length control protein FliK